MKSLKNLLLISIIGSLLFSNCATIVGGSKYYAHVVVADKPSVKIFHEGEMVGTGNATIKVKRSQADNFSIVLKADGCPDRKYEYQSKTFRGWAFVGTIITWTGVVNGVPLPWGVGLDLATGAVWKPNTNEKGVSKIDYKNYKYLVSFPNCDTKPESSNIELIDKVYLKNGGIIKGTIIEQIPNVQIKIQTKDGSIFVYKLEEIDRMTREPLK